MRTHYISFGTEIEAQAFLRGIFFYLEMAPYHTADIEVADRIDVTVAGKFRVTIKENNWQGEDTKLSILGSDLDSYSVYT